MWNYTKQDHVNRELIVVSDDDDWPEWVTFVRCDSNIPTKRNLAMAVADGDAITWFDDDDWQHPSKLSIISPHVSIRTTVGCTHSFFYNPLTNLVAAFDGAMLFNSVGVARYGLPAFDESQTVGSDTSWLSKLDYRDKHAVDDLLFFWITHKHNISNPVHRRRPSEKLDYQLDGETWQQLKKLAVLLQHD